MNKENLLDKAVGHELIEWEEFPEGIRLAFKDGEGWFDVCIPRVK